MPNDINNIAIYAIYYTAIFGGKIKFQISKSKKMNNENIQIYFKAVIKLHQSLKNVINRLFGHLYKS